MSGNNVSHVWHRGEWVYKRMPKFMCDNAMHAYTLMSGTGYVPTAERVDIETIRVRFIEKQPITDADLFAVECGLFMRALHQKGLRHGDLTIYSMIPYENRPMVIDWAESRVACDPRPDKRREGDEYWVLKTMKELVEQSEIALNSSLEENV